MRVLVTGATGYIGGRLVPALLAGDPRCAASPAPRRSSRTGRDLPGRRGDDRRRAHRLPRRAGRDEGLSEHLESRHGVGRVLADGPVPVTELRAAVMIGSGSASFEMLRNLVDVLPAMVTPRWVDTRCQPIAIRDMLQVLVGVLDVDGTVGEVLEVGGPTSCRTAG